jgi:penicillin-binding protein 2
VPPSMEDRRPPITPQLARRVALLGGIAFVLFAALFFRLWFLQVLSGDDYVSQAAQNKVRKIRIEAPRGNVVDRKDNVLIKTRQAAVVQILPSRLPEAERDVAAAYGSQVSAAERERLAAGDRLKEFNRDRRRSGRKMTKRQRSEFRRLTAASKTARTVAVPDLPADPEVRVLYRRLGKVLDMSATSIHKRVVQQVAQTPYAAVTVKTDIGQAAYRYLKERQADFPGVNPEIQYLRDYPFKSLGAHLFGTLREISPDELKEKQYRGIQQGERIGAGGIEQEYDKYLRGEDGYYRQVVDALGQPCEDPVRCPVRRVKPQQGSQVKLTLDLKLEREGTEALSEVVPAGRGGAFVAMDPRNGDVLGLGSYPTYDANLFAKPISQEKYNELNSEEEGKPLLDRAIDGLYPTASTFKLVTAAAALEEGLIDRGSIINDDGEYELGQQVFKNAGDAVFGAINVVQALTVSSDVFFYTLGDRMYSMPGQVLQTWARRFGFGKPTGIDLPGEFGGLVPDRKWRDTGYRKWEACRKKNNLPTTGAAVLSECGGIDRPYSTGDNVNLSVGQGDLQATPLQLATAYAALANGGRLVTPHLGAQVEDGQGKLLQKLRFPTRRKIDLSEETRSAIMEGLRGAASADGGTSSDVFAGLKGLDIYGKTGTAERGNDPDQSWYVAFVESEGRPIVVAVTVEAGGFGADTAAPTACRIIANWYDRSGASCKPGEDTSN